jgi:hypothetical protein
MKQVNATLKQLRVVAELASPFYAEAHRVRPGYCHTECGTEIYCCGEQVKSNEETGVITYQYMPCSQLLPI